MAIVIAVFKKVMFARASMSLQGKINVFPRENGLKFRKFGENNNGFI
jgi:hypothetical protein